jgi:LacI family transcriptional regulator
LQDAAEDKGEMIAVVRRPEDSPIDEVEQIQQILERQKVDGFVLWPTWNVEKHSRAIEYLKDEKIPFVVVPDADLDVFGDCNTVSNSESTASNDVMTHLIGRGYQKIHFAHHGNILGEVFNTLRYQQYRKCMELAGLTPQTALDAAEGDINAENLRQADAVFCATDDVAVQVIRTCLAEGIRVPADLAVVGYDNTKTARDLELSSVEQHFEQIGTMAVELLLQDIEGEPDGPKHLSAEPELIIRKSSCAD